MHGFDSRQDNASTAKGFEAQHGPDEALDESMILFDNMVQVFGLTQLEGCAGGFCRKVSERSRTIVSFEFFYVANE